MSVRGDVQVIAGPAFPAASLALALAGCLAACAPATSPAASMTAKATPSLTSRIAPSHLAKRDAATCATCHVEIAAEWRGSFHRVAFSDATFQESLSLELPHDRGFCIDCHAPAGKRASREDGVDCASCHASVHGAHDDRAASVASSVSSDPGDATCAACHEFSFDRGRAELVQKTLSEHAASDFAGVRCASCHMPRAAGFASHRFVSGHAPETLGGSVHVTADRRGPKTVRIAIRVDAGHAFPTGDMFRRARLELFAEDASGRIVGDAERVFGRTWSSIRDGANAGGRTESGDTRIRGTWSEDLTFDAPVAPPAAIARLRWSLVFERVVAARGDHVTLASSDEIARGDLAW